MTMSNTGGGKEGVLDEEEDIWADDDDQNLNGDVPAMGERVLASDSSSPWDSLLCPITGLPMIDPVVGPSGHSFERSAIETWLAQKGTDPITRMPSSVESLVTNHTLRRLMADVSEHQRVSGSASRSGEALRRQVARTIALEAHIAELKEACAGAGLRNPESQGGSSTSAYVAGAVGAVCGAMVMATPGVSCMLWGGVSYMIWGVILILGGFAGRMASGTWAWVELLMALDSAEQEWKERRGREKGKNARRRQADAEATAADGRIRYLRTLRTGDTSSSGGIRALELSGTRLLSSSADYEVRLWNLDTFECSQVLAGKSSEVWAMAGREGCLITGAFDHKIRCYGLGSGMECSQDTNLYSLRLGSTSCEPATPYTQADAPGAAERTSLPPTPGPLPSITHGLWLFSAQFDFTVCVYRKTSKRGPGARDGCLAGHTGWVRCLTCDDVSLEEAGPDALQSLRVYSGSNDTTVRVWARDVRSRDAGGWLCQTVLRGHTGPVLALLIHGGLLMSGSEDASVRLWNRPAHACKAERQPECLQVLDGHSSGVWALAASGRMLVSGSSDQTIKVWGILRRCSSDPVQKNATVPEDRSCEHEHCQCRSHLGSTCTFNCLPFDPNGSAGWKRIRFITSPDRKDSSAGLATGGTMQDQ